MRNAAQLDENDLWNKDRTHSIHGWTDYSTFLEVGSEILVEADGVYVTDIKGNRLMDGMGGVWCVNVGYGCDEIADAVSKQIRKLPYANPFRNTSTPVAAELTAKLADLAPKNLNHVFFSGGGSTANDSALRIIQLYFNTLGKHGKKQVIARHDGYHGSSTLTAALSGIPFNKMGFDVSEDGIHYVTTPNSYRRPDGVGQEEFCDYLVEEFESVIERVGAENIACFYAEPVMGMGGVIVPPDGYYPRISQLCKRNEILIVADEVVTAFGRIGKFFASDDVFQMSPDIITSAKGLTSGYLPMGATIISSDIMEVLRTPVEKGAIFAHGFTYAEHPVCCAAALANIGVIEKYDLCGHVERTAPYFREQLSTLMELDLVGDVRGAGFMMAVESVKDKKTKELHDPEIRIGDRVAKYTREAGLIVRPSGHLNIMSPCLTMQKEDIDFLVSILRSSIQKVQDDLTRL